MNGLVGRLRDGALEEAIEIEFPGQPVQPLPIQSIALDREDADHISPLTIGDLLARAVPGQLAKDP